jgi:hypothetical protein
MLTASSWISSEGFLMVSIPKGFEIIVLVTLNFDPEIIDISKATSTVILM